MWGQSGLLLEQVLKDPFKHFAHKRAKTLIKRGFGEAFGSIKQIGFMKASKGSSRVAAETEKKGPNKCPETKAIFSDEGLSLASNGFQKCLR